MSMHIACAGMADHQRNLYEKSKLNGRDFQMANIVEEEGLEGKYKFTPEFQVEILLTFNIGEFVAFSAIR